MSIHDLFKIIECLLLTHGQLSSDPEESENKFLRLESGESLYQPNSILQQQNVELATQCFSEIEKRIYKY